MTLFLSVHQRCRSTTFLFALFPMRNLLSLLSLFLFLMSFFSDCLLRFLWCDFLDVVCVCSGSVCPVTQHATSNYKSKHSFIFRHFFQVFFFFLKFFCFIISIIFLGTYVYTWSLSLLNSAYFNLTLQFLGLSCLSFPVQTTVKAVAHVFPSLPAPNPGASPCAPLHGMPCPYFYKLLPSWQSSPCLHVLPYKSQTHCETMHHKFSCYSQKTWNDLTKKANIKLNC